MMRENKKLKSIITSLESQGISLDQEAMEYNSQGRALRSVFIKVVSVLGGLLAMAMFMGFLGLVVFKNLENGIVLMVIGVIILAVSYFINKSRDSAVKDGIVVALYISGFITFLTGVGFKNDIYYERIVAYTTIGLAVLSLVCLKNQITNFISCITCFVAIHYLLVDSSFLLGVNILLMLLITSVTLLYYKESSLRTTNSWWNENFQSILTACFSYSLLLSIICSTVKYSQFYYVEEISIRYISTISYILVTLLSLYLLLVKLRIKSSIVQIITLVVIGLFLYFLGMTYPAFIVGFLFILWSFNNQYKVGLVLAICTFVWAMGMFYYDLSISLLNKSISLMLSGVVFLGVYWLIQKNWKKDETK